MDKNQRKQAEKETTSPLIVIVGQTASGKSALAIKVAQKYGGEIICADSRTIYKGMNIGTAKPSAEDQNRVPHYGLDLIKPDESFSAAAFKDYAADKVSQISRRGNLPIIAGGTGLYVDGYIYDYSFAEPASDKVRSQLAMMNLEELQSKARQLGIEEGDVNFKNPRHLSRAIERGGVKPVRQKIRPNTLLLGLKIDKTELEKRIDERVDKMFEDGLVDEVQNLINQYGADSPGLLAPGYKAVGHYLIGCINIDEAKNEFKRNDKQLAKRQLTWFKRNKDINWADSEDQALSIVKEFILTNRV